MFFSKSCYRYFADIFGLNRGYPIDNGKENDIFRLVTITLRYISNDCPVLVKVGRTGVYMGKLLTDRIHVFVSI